ncbi:hypothetical protein D3C84_817420 [compost metagenome]
MLPRIEILAWLAIALAEFAIVECQRGTTNLVERFAVMRHHDFLRITPASGHYYERDVALRTFWDGEYAFERVTAAVEFHLFLHANSSAGQ